MTLNPVGFVKVADLGGLPVTFSARAISAISGGQFVYAGSQAATVSSGTNSFADGDIWIGAPASGVNFPIGVATQNAASGAEVTVARKLTGMISVSEGTIVAGDLVVIGTGVNALDAGSQAAISSAELQSTVGKALTCATSGGYVLHTVDL